MCQITISIIAYSLLLIRKYVIALIFFTPTRSMCPVLLSFYISWLSEVPCMVVTWNPGERMLTRCYGNTFSRVLFKYWKFGWLEQSLYYCLLNFVNTFYLIEEFTIFLYISLRTCIYDDFNQVFLFIHYDQNRHFTFTNDSII